MRFILPSLIEKTNKCLIENVGFVGGFGWFRVLVTTQKWCWSSCPRLCMVIWKYRKRRTEANNNMVYLLFYQQEVILPHSISRFWNIALLSPLPAVAMSDVHQDFMREWARNNGKTMQQRTVRQKTSKYKSGTLPLNMIRLKNKLERNYSLTGQVRKGKKQ